MLLRWEVWGSSWWAAIVGREDVGIGRYGRLTSDVGAIQQHGFWVLMGTYWRYIRKAGEEG